jgi:membrane associated rhomboid family serine protease
MFKVRILKSAIFISIFLIIWVALNFMFENLSAGFKGMISGGISVILAPRLKRIQSQSGNQMQLKWIFLKKPILIRI